MAKPITYFVNWQLEHDGKTYPPGAKIELDSDIAEPLLSCGVIASEKAAIQTNERDSEAQ